MRDHFVEGRRVAGALLCALVLVASACAPPNPQQVQQASPTPSPSPGPTAPLALGTPSFHAGEVGLSYNLVALSATGGASPYKWSISAGALPAGLTLADDGSITGTPTKPGTFTFTVQAADSSGATAAKSAAVTVYAALAVTQPCATKCNIGAGCSRCGAFGTASRGLGPYTYRVAGGSVPQGMTMSGLSLAGGFPAGTHRLSVLVTDRLGAQATVGANWSIYSPARLAGGSSCSNYGNPPQCVTTGWTYAGGSPVTAPRVVIVGYKQYCPSGCNPIPTAPPPGWKVAVKGSAITFSAGGIPCNAPSYSGYVTVALVDPSTCATTSQSNRVDLLVDISNNC